MDKIGKYEVIEEVGKGGFGVVYKGRDPFIRRLVAIKTCSSDSEEIRARFFREAQIAGNLHHTNVVTIHDFGVENETPFIVQEYIRGEDLDQKIKGRQPLTFEQKLRYLVGISQGLAYAHSKGVVHRDIKPSNIRITQDGHAKVMDFGIAKLSHVKSHLTQTGTTLGTVTYLAPEQLQGSQVDHRCDIFSFGVLAYEVFAYHRPFEGESVSQVFYEILHGNPSPLREHVPNCPERLNALVMKCLAKNPDERHSSFDTIRMEIEEVLDELDDDTLQVTTTRQILTPPPQILDTDSQKQAEMLAREGGLPGEGPPPEDLLKLQRLAERAREAVQAGDLTGAEVSIDLARRDHSDTIVYHQLFDPLVLQLADLKKEKEADIHRQEALAAHLADARAARKKGDLEAALLAARKCLELEPVPDEARQLVVELERELEEKRRREEHETALARAIAAIEQAIDDGKLDEAEGELSTAREQLGEESALLVLDERLVQQRRQQQLETGIESAKTRLDAGSFEAARSAIEEAREIADDARLDELSVEIDLRERHHAADELTEAARREIAADRLEAALESLRQAIALVPDHPAGELLESTEADLAQRQEAERREQARQQALAAIAEDLDAGRLDAAERRLDEARKELGDLDQLDELASRLATARLEQRIAEILARTDEAIAADKLEDARKIAQGALGDFADRPEVEAKLAEIAAKITEIDRALEDRAERERLAAAERERQELANTLAGLEAAISAGHFDRAEAGLAEARDRFDAEQELDRIAASLEAARLERRAASLLSEIESALAKQELDRARKIAKGALEELPQRPEIEARLAEIAAKIDQIDQAIEERAERARIAALEQEARAKIQGLLDEHDLAAAAQALAEARRSLGDEAALPDLATAIDSARRALSDTIQGLEAAIAAGHLDQAAKGLAEARQRFDAKQDFDRLESALETARVESAVRARLAEIERALSAQDLDGAREVATKALEEIPKRQELESRLADIERALEERAERQRLEKLAREARDRIQKLLDAQDLPAAAKALTAARKSLGDDDALPELAAAIDTARRKLRANEIAAEATKLLAAEKWSAALHRAEEALDLDGSSPDAARVVEKARGEIERERLEKERREQRARAAGLVEELLQRGKLRPARKRLQSTLDSVGGDERLAALEQQLVRAEQERAESSGSKRGLLYGGIAAAVVVAVIAAVVLSRGETSTSPTDVASAELGTGVDPDRSPTTSPLAERTENDSATDPAADRDPPADSSARDRAAAENESGASPVPSSAAERTQAREPESERTVQPPPREQTAAPPADRANAGEQSDRAAASDTGSTTPRNEPAATESTQGGATQSGSRQTESPPPASTSPERTPQQPAPTTRREPEPVRTQPQDTPAERAQPDRTTQQPRAEPEARPATPTPPPDERPGVQSALAQYARAFEALDVDAVVAIYPSANRDELDRAFRNLRSFRIELDPAGCRLQIAGERATATCQVVRSVQTRTGGRERSNTATERFELGKSSGAWKILSQTAAN